MFVHHTNLEDARKDDRKLVCYDCGVACDLSAMRGERDRSFGEAPRGQTARRDRGRARPREALAKSAAAESCKASARRYRFTFTKLGRERVSLAPRRHSRVAARVSSRGPAAFLYVRFSSESGHDFFAALSLGVMSLGEIVDMKLCATRRRSSCDGSTRSRKARRRACVSSMSSARSRRRADLEVIDRARYALAIPRERDRRTRRSRWRARKSTPRCARSRFRSCDRSTESEERVDVRTFCAKPRSMMHAP